MNNNDLIGTIGVALILMAYFCSTFKWMSAHGRIFFMFNAVGAFLACLASFRIHYWPFVLLEGTWTVVSVIGYIKARY
jgi:hypothetical protein